MIDEVEVLSCVAELGIKPPSMSPTLRKINTELRETEPSVQLVANLVAIDAGLANPVLGIVNSAGGGALVRIHNVRQAVQRMGLNGMRVLCNTITWIALNKDVKNVRENRQFIDFLWEYNVRVATAAEQFARFCNLGVRFENQYPNFYDELNTACLFANSGALYISLKYPHEYEVSLRAAAGKLGAFAHDLPGAEYLDTNIPINILLSAAFVKSWDAPEHIVNAVLAQSDASKIPPGPHAECALAFVYILVMARFIVNTLYEGHKLDDCVLHDSDTAITQAHTKLGIAADKMQDFMSEDRMEEITQALSRLLNAVK